MIELSEERRREHHLAALDRFVAALQRAPDATVPAYPTWRVRELAAHVVKVHTMAAVAIETAATERPEVEGPADPSQDLGTLTGHLLAAYDRLEVALRTTALTSVWALRADRPPRAWRRRMLLETNLHAFDATAAEGAPQAPLDEVGLDGVDEFLNVHGWAGLQSAEALEGTVELRTDGATWRVELATGSVAADPDAGSSAGAVVSGPAAALWLWCNRRLPLPASVDVDDRDGTGARFVAFLDGLRGPAGPARPR